MRRSQTLFLLFALLFVFQVPAVLAPDPGDDTVKIITYNVHGLLYNEGQESDLPLEASWTLSSKRLQILALLADFIASEQPDVVLLQEWDEFIYDEDNWRDYYGYGQFKADVHAADELSALLAQRGHPMHYQWVFVRDFDPWVSWGMLVLSSRPIYDHEEIPLDGISFPRCEAENNCDWYNGWKDVQTFRIDLDSDGQPDFRFFNYHGHGTADAGAASLEALERIIDRYPNDMAVLGGDFNAGLGSPGYAGLAEDFLDTCTTFVSENPQETSCLWSVDRRVFHKDPDIDPPYAPAIDFLVMKRDTYPPYDSPWQVISARTDLDIYGNPSISDHLPVIAVIAPGDRCPSTPELLAAITLWQQGDTSTPELLGVIQSWLSC